ncbi:MAG: TIGR03560 family F420-dependent LLM class oxidoreductase [Thermomicrobiales bacterium]
MVELAVMIEGQDGLNWPRWRRLAEAAEGLGYAGLYRSDHFVIRDGGYQDALELWVSLTWLASHTSRIEFGPMVSPVSFRDPVITAWQAMAVDDLSGGRLRLGLGAGWNEREHRSFGYDLLDLDQRFARFQEGIKVVRLLMGSDEPVSFSGEYYRLDDAQMLPRPARLGGPPIVIGGKGPRRTLPLVARYADEWNATSMPTARLQELNVRLDDLIRQEGRQPSDVRRTLMTRVIFGRDDADLRRQTEGLDVAAMRERGSIIGTPNEVVEALGRFAEAGAARVMCQWLDQDDIAGLEAMAATVMPRVA